MLGTCRRPLLVGARQGRGMHTAISAKTGRLRRLLAFHDGPKPALGDTSTYDHQLAPHTGAVDGRQAVRRAPARREKLAVCTPAPTQNCMPPY